jgi:predicted DNA-binding WGR domain protein
MTDDLLVVAFEAHHPAANRHRRYEVAVGRDLLGDWTVTIRYGRIGQDGQEKRYAAATAEPVRAVLRTHLLRRLSAPRRIGCAYRLVTCVSIPGFELTDWFLGDLIGRFPIATG